MREGERVPSLQCAPTQCRKRARLPRARVGSVRRGGKWTRRQVLVAVQSGAPVRAPIRQAYSRSCGCAAGMAAHACMLQPVGDRGASTEVNALRERGAVSTLLCRCAQDSIESNEPATKATQRRTRRGSRGIRRGRRRRGGRRRRRRRRRRRLN